MRSGDIRNQPNIQKATSDQPTQKPSPNKTGDIPIGPWYMTWMKDVGNTIKNLIEYFTGSGQMQNDTGEYEMIDMNDLKQRKTTKVEDKALPSGDTFKNLIKKAFTEKSEGSGQIQDDTGEYEMIDLKQKKPTKEDQTLPSRSSTDVKIAPPTPEVAPPAPKVVPPTPEAVPPTPEAAPPISELVAPPTTPKVAPPTPEQLEKARQNVADLRKELEKYQPIPASSSIQYEKFLELYKKLTSAEKALDEMLPTEGILVWDVEQKIEDLRKDMSIIIKKHPFEGRPEDIKQRLRDLDNQLREAKTILSKITNAKPPL